ncbi:MAG: TrbI/VirB10 family protein [Elusimicrobia bacterium]|nr:TrbI/VirB10 family protein [Elusimicrobiota bacterium]
MRAFRSLAFLAAGAVLSCPVRAEDRRAGDPPPAACKRGRHKPAEGGQPQKPDCFLPTGLSFPARLDNAVYSYNVETPAVAVVERPISFLNRVVIPAGTRVIGTVAIQKSHDRVLVNFHTVVFPEGDEIKLSGMALSLDGSAGLKGKAENHKDSAVANTVLRSVVSGTQAALDITGVSPIASQATQGISQEALRELDMEKQQVTTSISVDADTGLRIYVNQRLEY